MAVENITYMVSKDTYDSIKNEQYVNMMIHEYLSNELIKKLVEILDEEGEIVTKVSDVSEKLNVYLDAVVFKRQLQDNSYDYDTFKEQKRHCPLQKIDLVRCGECKWCDDKGKGRALICTNPYIDMDIHPLDFCSYGERRTDDHIEDLDGWEFTKAVYENFDPYQGERGRDAKDIYVPNKGE